MAKKRKYGEVEKFEKLFSFFFTHGFLLSRKEFLIFFYVQGLRFHVWIFWRNFHVKNCVSHTLSKKTNAKNSLSRILPKKKLTKDLHSFTYKKKHRCTVRAVWARRIWFMLKKWKILICSISECWKFNFFSPTFLIDNASLNLLADGYLLCTVQSSVQCIVSLARVGDMH